MNDVSFVIAQLANQTFAKQHFSEFPGTFNASRVAVVGHSFGGATTATVLQRDERAIGGINWDGPIFGAVNEQGFKDKPYILVASTREVESSPYPIEYTWTEFYKHIDPPKIQLVILDTQHYGFSDLPLLREVIAEPAELQPGLNALLGRLDGRKWEKALNDIFVASLDLFCNDDIELLENVDENQDIEVIKSDLSES